MKFAERNRKFIEKLQSLPEKQKKIILWGTVGILAIMMGFFWVRGARENFLKIGQEVKNIKIPQVNTQDFPKMPDLNNLENQLNKLDTTAK